jgi:hypothetical protein
MTHLGECLYYMRINSDNLRTIVIMFSWRIGDYPLVNKINIREILIGMGVYHSRSMIS